MKYETPTKHKHNQLQVSIWFGGDDLLSQDMKKISYFKTSKFLSRKDALTLHANAIFVCCFKQVILWFRANTDRDLFKNEHGLCILSIRRSICYRATNNTELALLLLHKNDVKYGFIYTRLRWRKVCETNRSKFPLPDLLQCLERPGSVRNQRTLFLPLLYYKTPGKFPNMPNVCWWTDRRDFS